MSLAPGKANTATLGLSAGVGETDNVLRSSSNKRSQTLAVTALDVALSHHKPRLTAEATGSFEDLYYVQNAFGNQIVGSFSGNADIGLVPRRLDWVINEAYGQNLLNPLEPATSSNLQNINVVSTGPDLLFHPGGESNFLQLGARYARSDYQAVPFGGHQGIGMLVLGHDLSRTSSLALNITEQKMYFNNTDLNQNYTLRKAYGSYLVQGVRTAIEIQAGAVQTNDLSTRTSTWTTRPIAQIRLTRRLSPTMTLSMQGGRQVTDVADSFASLQGGAAGRIVVAPTYGTTSSYVDTYGSLGWDFALNRTSIGASASWQRSSYDLVPLFDTKIEDYTLGIRRRLTPRLGASVTGTLSKIDYYVAQLRRTAPTVDVNLQWRASRKVRLAIQYQYSEQESSQFLETLTRSGYFNLLSPSGIYSTNTYSANSVFLMLTYVPIVE